MALSAWQLATNDQQQDTKLSYSASSNRHATPIGNAPVSVLSKKDSKNVGFLSAHLRKVHLLMHQQLSNGYAMGRFLADDKDHLSFWISDGGSQSDKSLKHASTRKEPT